ncbi:AMSH-like protease sst2 [Sphaceloma murrayae]|uniref:AMSH-like protease sst2 n=1 Tax=Sphaceloma murrayae TaxID=2082308 RepID=A0A2K1R289_9PEZI|nr:AMSH-like protease sst2 [Sphaceloma murrayae]
MSRSMQRPQSVQEIVKEAQNFDHKTRYPLRIAIRTAQNILNQAVNCERSGNLQDAYLFRYRHAEFCMSQITVHSDRKLPEFKQAVQRVTKDVQEDLEKMETLKPEVAKRYERYQASLERIAAAREREKQQYQGGRGSGDSSRRSSRDFASLGDAMSAGYSQVLHAGEHSDLALKLAHRELKRRGIQDDAQDHHSEQKEFHDLAQNIRELGRRLDRTNIAEAPQSHANSFAYPGVRTHHETQVSSPSLYSSAHSAPAVPGKTPLPTEAPPILPPKAPVAASTEVLDSSEYTFKSTAKTEGGSLLRPLFIPKELRPRFLSLASNNTRNNLETCGILCGSLLSNALFISHLVIPEQISTSDTCDTTEEGDNALFDYVDGQELMVCGWIHTHPTQTCFLSSRDLHTSVGYQVMLPESVAIVCAPSRDPDYGIFRLTDPPGKQAILNCDQQGLFHPHAQSNLYTDAVTPGHVSELKGLQFQVVDMRKR